MKLWQKTSLICNACCSSRHGLFLVLSIHSKNSILELTYSYARDRPGKSLASLFRKWRVIYCGETIRGLWEIPRQLMLLRLPISRTVRGMKRLFGVSVNPRAFLRRLPAKPISMKIAEREKTGAMCLLRAACSGEKHILRRICGGGHLPTYNAK